MHVDAQHALPFTMAGQVDCCAKFYMLVCAGIATTNKLDVWTGQSGQIATRSI